MTVGAHDERAAVRVSELHGYVGMRDAELEQVRRAEVAELVEVHSRPAECSPYRIRCRTPNRDAAREIDETVESAELHLYPGDKHLFADKSLADYDDIAATLLKQRALSFLDEIE
jgi:dienelactone hydrolase